MCEHPRGWSRLCELLGSSSWVARFTRTRWGIAYLQLLAGLKKCPESIISSNIALLQLWNISQGMDEWENGKQQENSPDQTFPGPKQQCGAVQLQLHLTEFDLSMSKKGKVTKKGKSWSKGVTRIWKYFNCVAIAEMPLPILWLLWPATGGKCFCTTHSLWPVSWDYGIGGSPAEMQVPGTPSLSIPCSVCDHTLSQPEQLPSPQNNQKKPSQFMRNFPCFVFSVPDQFPDFGLNARHNWGTEAWEEREEKDAWQAKTTTKLDKK